MDKKTKIIAISWIALGSLGIEYWRLVHDFKLLSKILKENEAKFEHAKQIVTDSIFIDIVENFDQ